jgi:hypothetical protein
MPTPLLLLLLSLLILPGCIPLYIRGAHMAVSTVAGVASGVAAGGASAEAELPHERVVLLELYKNCLRQQALTPGVECGRYRAAVLAAPTP